MIRSVATIFSKKKLSECDLIINQIRKIYKYAPSDFGGGCSYQKALAMALFIKELNLQTSADIGVYRGRSLFPQAIAHKRYTKGIAYGIDPFNNLAAVQNDQPDLKESLDNFLQNTDFDKLYKAVTDIIKRFKLGKNCKLIRERSEEAKLFFSENNIQLGLVHIDGNHDTTFVSKDVNDYLPLVTEGGIVLVDDISWDSVKPALEIMHSSCVFIGNVTDSLNDFSIFIKKPSSVELVVCKKIVEDIKNHNYPGN